MKLSDEVGEDGTSKCLESKKQCIEYVPVCQSMKHICNSEMVIACNDYQKIYDFNECEKEEFVCKV